MPAESVDSTADSKVKVKEKLPQYMGSMWNSITKSSSAVTSAVHTHLVSKIPLLGNL